MKNPSPQIRILTSNATTTAHWGTEASAVSAPAALQWQHRQHWQQVGSSANGWSAGQSLGQTGRIGIGQEAEEPNPA